MLLNVLSPCAVLLSDGFLAYESSIPKALLDAGGPRTGKMDINNTIGHFELVNYQLKEVG
jgi:hypothetical protein